MLRSSEVVLAALLLAGPAATAARGAPAKPAAPALARLTFVERRAELLSARGWHEATEGMAVRLGERLRTPADSLARLEMPWMTLTVSPASAVGFPDEHVLSAVLEQGRVQLHADNHEILKLVTGEAEVRGQGRAVVRRQGNATLVTSLTGRFLVSAAGKTVALSPGMGTIVRQGKPPLAPLALPAPPEGLSPGADPRYAMPGDAVSLSWTPRGGAHQVEVLPVGADYVLIQRDVGAPPWRLAIPWPGAFRWRVATRDERGLEGKPSAEGLICIDK
jgi:hypothetical protein